MAQTPPSGTGRARAEAMKRRDRFVRSLEGRRSAFSGTGGRQRKGETEKAGMKPEGDLEI